jgi:putative transposase
MARIPRVVASGIPHHITQNGNRSQDTFFTDDDYRAYIALMSESCRRFGVEIWAYCLMNNHVHMLAVPEEPASLRSAIGEAHRRYTRAVNLRNNWRGHLWQERFSSFPLNENYVLAAAHYIETNPVRAQIASDPFSYPWSSARCHVLRRDNELVRVKPLLDLVPDWETFLLKELVEKDYQQIRQHGRTGRPLGDEIFIKQVENVCHRCLLKKKPGPKKKNQGDACGGVAAT